MAGDAETLAAGKAWLLARLEGGAHPLDGLDPDAARATIAALTGLDPEAWTAAWGGLADTFAAKGFSRGETEARNCPSRSMKWVIETIGACDSPVRALAWQDRHLLLFKSIW